MAGLGRSADSGPILVDEAPEGRMPMKVPQTYSDGEIRYLRRKTPTVWTGTIKRLIHGYLERRNKRRALRRGCTENKVVAPLEGRRWCDATERELIGDIATGHRVR